MRTARMSKLGLAICACLLACAIAAQAAPAWAARVPPVTDEDVAQAIQLAGSNAEQIRQAAEAYPDDALKHAAMRFLIVSLPLVDLGVISAAQLQENVDLAVQARREFAYCQDYDDAVWAHYVLPVRVSQEPLSPWRSYFYEQLRSKVAGCQTIGEAATIVSAYYGTLATYKPTQSRDQSPIATLKGGYGRCEELVILFIDCCRAVGIPARQAYCPYWAAGDDNHAWWEVLGSDGRWHLDVDYGSGENREANWVVQSARQAPLVVAVCFGLPGPDEAGAEVLGSRSDIGARYCQLNSATDYRLTGRLVVSAPTGAALTDPATGKPRKLMVHVYNYGALRVVARLDFDAAGQAVVTLGVGDYMISTDLNAGPRTAFVHIAAGTETRLNWADASEAPSELVLYFPKDPPPA